MRTTRVFPLLALVLAIGLGSCYSEVEGAQQQQQQKKKKTTPPKKEQVTPPMFNAPIAPLPPRVRANGNPASTAAKTVEKEAEYTVADDATVLQLKEFPTGLNFVAAEIGDL